MNYTHEYIIKYIRNNKKYMIEHLNYSNLLLSLKNLKDITITKIIKKFFNSEDPCKIIFLEFYNKSNENIDIDELLKYFKLREKLRNYKFIEDYDIDLIKEFNNQTRNVIYISI